MFTGIIEAKAKIRVTKPQKSGVYVEVEKPRRWKFTKGQSIAVDGICTTVIASGKNSFSVQYMPETLSKTTASEFTKGRVLNLERSLKLQQFVDGHLTQGHVDARVRVRSIEKKNGAHLITVDVPKNLTRYVAPHGSLTLNGVSLTVARAKAAQATVALIPHTLMQTNLGEIKTGDFVNLEVDLIARYVIHSSGMLQ